MEAMSLLDKEKLALSNLGKRPDERISIFCESTAIRDDHDITLASFGEITLPATGLGRFLNMMRHLRATGASECAFEGYGAFFMPGGDRRKVEVVVRDSSIRISSHRDQAEGIESLQIFVDDLLDIMSGPYLWDGLYIPGDGEQLVGEPNATGMFWFGGNLFVSPCEDTSLSLVERVAAHDPKVNAALSSWLMNSEISKHKADLAEHPLPAAASPRKTPI